MNVAKNIMLDMWHTTNRPICRSNKKNLKSNQYLVVAGRQALVISYNCSMPTSVQDIKDTKTDTPLLICSGFQKFCVYRDTL